MHLLRARTPASSSQRGFGLVELIVVVAILGVLVLVAIPVFGAVQTKARDEVVKSELTNFAQTIEILKHESKDGRYPVDLDSTRVFTFTPDAYGLDVQNRTLRYCYNAETDNYIFYARSITGNYFSVSPTGGLKADTAAFGYSVCSKIGLSSKNPISDGIYEGRNPKIQPWVIVR